MNTYEMKSDIGLSVNNIESHNSFRLESGKSSSFYNHPGFFVRFIRPVLFFTGKFVLCLILMGILLYEYFYLTIPLGLAEYIYMCVSIMAGISIAILTIILWMGLSLYE